MGEVRTVTTRREGVANAYSDLAKARDKRWRGIYIYTCKMRDDVREAACQTKKRGYRASKK